MSGCCACCCSPFKPRYKRLVDTIFPANHEDGLVKANMEKLIFYALSSPGKLDKIGAYLAERIGRDLSRHRIGFVIIAVEAMDQLLISCHCLNLFVESFLKVVQLVLESQDPELQILATQSFVKFAKIDEETPSYHRSYDFFVSKFSSLCHSNHADIDMRKRLRVAGLIGIKGLVRKTVSEQMQVGIWTDNNMEKIIPSLLFNMQPDCFSDETKMKGSDNRKSSAENGATSGDDPDDDSEVLPHVIATECLRELINLAMFGHVNSILKPIIIHFHLHRLWEAAADNPAESFAVKTFKIIMYSIPSQHYFTVIQSLMDHLDCISFDKFEQKDFKIENKAKVQTGIVNVVNKIVSIPSDSIGPLVNEMIISLLRHLRHSISNVETHQHLEEEKQFQDAVINTLAEFATNLPDYQKIETMIIIIEKAPEATCTAATEQQLQNIILKSLLMVTTKYQPVSMIQTFPSSFLGRLLTRALAPDPRARLIVQKIFHQLLDRHKNLHRLMKPVTLTPPEALTIEKANRYDINFMRKHGHDILVHIYNNIQIESNTTENFHSIYTTMALICVEMNSDEVVIDLLRLTFALQELANSKSNNLTDYHRCQIHSVLAGFLHLFSHLKGIPAIYDHVEQVIKEREAQNKFLLPEYCQEALEYQGNLFRPAAISYNKESSPSRQNSVESLVPDELLFNKNVISEALQTTGHETSALNTPFQSATDVDSSMTKSNSDLNGITLEIDSANSSPGVPRKFPEPEVTFTMFKEVLESPAKDSQDDSKRRINLLNNFKNNKFEDLVDTYSECNKSLPKIMFDTIDKTVDVRKLSNDIFDNGPTTDTLDHDQPSNRSAAAQEPTTNAKWHLIDNPLLSLCDISQINARAPPLFALEFPNLFVY